MPLVLAWNQLVSFLSICRCFANRQIRSSHEKFCFAKGEHLNHFLQYQNSKCFDTEVKKAVSQKKQKK